MSELGEPRRRSRSPRRKGRGRGRPGRLGLPALRFGRLPSCLGRRAPARTPMAYPPAINIAPSALDPIPQSHTHTNTLRRVNGQTNERKMICNAWVDLVCVRLIVIGAMWDSDNPTLLVFDVEYPSRLTYAQCPKRTMQGSLSIRVRRSSSQVRKTNLSYCCIISRSGIRIETWRSLRGEM